MLFIIFEELNHHKHPFLLINDTKNFTIKYWQCDTDKTYESSYLKPLTQTPFGWLYPEKEKFINVEFKSNSENKKNLHLR